ncbi:MAG: glycerol-3-phosphate acyltransferase [Planctomycetes bacterium]|nr:glycerol-3-phosphate acyltransferase [Planctomycetota bacterium]
MLPWLLVPAAYLLGSVSFAWFAGRLNGVDLRTVGSGNLGATNAGRVLGGRWFAFVFAGDVLKGFLPLLAGRLLDADCWLLLALAAAAVVGHVFTCFHRFKGGKAVATSLGCLAGLVPAVAGLTLALWLLLWTAGWLLFKATRANAVGPASVLAALAVPGLRWLTCAQPLAPAEAPVTWFLIALAVLVVGKHHSNIRKLFARKAA